MKCKYIYKGRTFESEADLDEFLLINENLKESDLVFQYGNKLQKSINKQISKSNESVEKAIKRGEISLIEESGEPEDTDNLKGNGTYLSITELIHKIRTIDSQGEEHPLFPIYDGDNYWNEQWKKYQSGNYDEKIMAQIPFIEDLLYEYKSGDTYLAIKDQNTLQKIRERMESVWKQQALCGDLVHALLSDFYKKKTKEDKRLCNSSKSEIKQVFDKITKNEFYSKYSDYIDDNVLNTVIDEAIKLDKEIRTKYGEDCMILSEKRIVGTGTIGNNSVPIVGKMDLFVISSNGKMAILDFKCSPKDYTEHNEQEDPTKYDPAKVLTFKYQLAAYRRLLNSIGISNPDFVIDLGIVPLKFINYRFNQNTEKVAFDGVSSMENSIQILSNTEAISGGNLYSTIEGNLEQIFPKSFNLDNLTTDNLLSKIYEDEKTFFKEMKKRKNMSDGEIADWIKNKGGIKKNSITGEWEFRPYKSDDRNVYRANGKKYKEVAEIEIFSKVKQSFQRIDNYVPNVTSSIRTSFKEAFIENSPMDFTRIPKNVSYSNKDPLYTQKQLEKYNDPIKYELISREDLDPILDQLGVLIFKNKITNLIDIVKISDCLDLKKSANLGGENSKNRNTILGTFLPDELVNADSNSQALEGTIGNVELMEVMILLNRMPGIFTNNLNGVGRIELINPGIQKGLFVTNEQLLYNFRRLCNLSGIENNFVDHDQTGKIKMADHVSLCKSTFDEILQSPNSETGLGKIYDSLKSEIKSCISDFDNLGENPNILRQRLSNLDKLLIDYYPNLIRETSAIQNEQNSPEYQLHRNILFAIAQLSGVKLLQQIEDHAKWNIGSSGISGTEIDNPGTLQSKTLNEFTDQVTKAYQNVRDNVIAFNQELRQKVEALKKAKGFGLLQQYTIGNQVSALYKNMFDPNSDDLLFVNPWNSNVILTNEERDFLKFAILKINDNRIKGFDPNNIEDLIKQDPVKYLKVPLTKGDLTSEVSIRDGWLNFIRSQFMRLTPSKLKARFDREAVKLFSDSQKSQIENGKIWESINYFDASEDEDYRKDLLSDESLGGKAYFEHNLETLLLKHTSAYKMAEELNNIFPVLRALTLHLNMQGAVLNEEFKNDLEYILKYIKTRIHNQPYENRKDILEKTVFDITRVMMSTTSKLTLAFNPRQWYQFIDGIWKDIQIYFRNAPEEGTPFTKEGLFFGWKKVFSEDLLHFGNDFTISELLNQIYGFNDMDVNSYIERIKTDNTGILYHFWNVGFRFASRPDFYNRMTLFYAQMHKDGSIGAHKVVNGKLVYDWTEDERFKAFAHNDKSNLEKYNQQKSLFITMAQQFEQEGVKNSDGTPYVMDLNNPSLPRAYTNRQSESMKALSDRIYGYYSHEKKSMIHFSTVGGLFMQMNTYWSAKKNQYAQTRSYTQEGDWAQYEEDGKKYYWKEDEDGTLIPTTENTGVPVQIWKGRPQEGIALTFFEMYKAFRGNSTMTEKSGINGVLDLFDNEEIDPQIRRLYSSNFRQLISDIVIWIIIGNLMLGSMENQVKDYVKSTGNKSAGKAFSNTLLSGGTSILRASTLDANFFESIFGRGKDWTPFAIKQTDRIAQNMIKVGTGKQDLFDFLVKSNGAMNQTRPMWDYIKISTLGRKIGDNGKEK